MPLPHSTFLSLIHPPHTSGRLTVAKTPRRRRSCLDGYAKYIQAQLVRHIETSKPRMSIRAIAQKLSQRLGRPVAHTTVARYIESRGLYRENV